MKIIKGEKRIENCFDCWFCEPGGYCQDQDMREIEQSEGIPEWCNFDDVEDLKKKEPTILVTEALKTIEKIEVEIQSEIYQGIQKGVGDFLRLAKAVQPPESVELDKRIAVDIQRQIKEGIEMGRATKKPAGLVSQISEDINDAIEKGLREKLDDLGVNIDAVLRKIEENSEETKPEPTFTVTEAETPKQTKKSRDEFREILYKLDNINARLYRVERDTVEIFNRGKAKAFLRDRSMVEEIKERICESKGHIERWEKGSLTEWGVGRLAGFHEVLNIIESVENKSAGVAKSD